MLSTRNKGPRAPPTPALMFFSMRHLSAWLLGTWGKKIQNTRKLTFYSVEFAQNKIQWIIFWTFVVRMHNWAYMKHSNSQPVDRIYVIVLSTIITAVILQPAPAVPAEWNSTGSASKFRPPVVFVSCTRFLLGSFLRAPSENLCCFRQLNQALRSRSSPLIWPENMTPVSFCSSPCTFHLG